MRWRLLLVGVVVLVALTFWAGWITFHSNDDRGSISIEKNEVRRDLEEVREGGAKLLDEASEAIDPAGNRPAAP